MANNNVTSRYFGEWHVNIQTEETNPEIIGDLRDLFTRANINKGFLNYTPLAYLGIQNLGSTIQSKNNVAVLAEQVNEYDHTGRIVIIIFYESDTDDIISIERVLESDLNSRKEYDIHIAPNTKIPDEVLKDYEIIRPHFNNMLVDPFIYLGSQKCLNGINHLLVAEVTSLDPVTKKDVALVTINAINKSYEITNVLV